MMSVTYRVTPALIDATFDRRDIDVTVRLDPPPDPDWWPGEIRPAGEHDMIPGAVETHGAFGPFVVPAETRRIELSFETIVLASVPDPRPPSDHVPRQLGQLVIDLAERSAAWHPAQTEPGTQPAPPSNDQLKERPPCSVPRATESTGDPGSAGGERSPMTRASRVQDACGRCQTNSSGMVSATRRRLTRVIRR